MMEATCYLDLRKRKQQEEREHSIVRSFMNFTLQHTRRLGLVEHAVRNYEKIREYRILVGNLKGRRLLDKPMPR
jgi:hypothetical protein